MNAILTVLCGIALLLFYLNKISSKCVILLIGIYVLSIGSNIEGYDSLSGSTSCDCSGLNSEALQNIASIYNSGELVLNNLTVTGDTKIAKTLYASNIKPYSTGSNININADGGQTYFTGGDVHADSGTFHAVNFESNRSDGNFICANRSGAIKTKYLC